MDIKSTPEYCMIVFEYRDKKAERSGLPLMNHIEEGLVILGELNASMDAQRAYCLHPMVQNDQALARNYLEVGLFCPGHTVLLAMEYRRAANAYLCWPETDHFTQTDILKAVGELLPEVRHMLIADKRQNQKDFRQHHKGSHPRSDQLEQYFIQWLTYLGVWASPATDCKDLTNPTN